MGSSIANAEALSPAYPERILRSIRQITRAVHASSHQLEIECGLTVTQLVCLRILIRRGSLSLKTLAAELDLSASTLVGVVDRLERKGLVRRERSTEDRRQVRISPTESGVMISAAAPSPLQERLATGLSALPELERAAIALAVERIVDLLRIPATKAPPILDPGGPHQLEIGLDVEGRADGVELQAPEPTADNAHG